MNNLNLEVNSRLIYSFTNSEIYFIPTTKYKTNTITFFFIDDLRKETVSKNAMIPAVLRRGCNKYPSMNEISLQLENLFGASFDCGIIKKGEYHVIFFYAECISDNYLSQKMKGNNQDDIFHDCIELLIDIITDPIIENGAFKPDFLKQEKENLKRLIKGRINDKVTYAIDRCFEEMCKDEPFGIYQYGDISGLEQVDETNLYHQYNKIIHNTPLKVFISGNIPKENIDYLKDILITKRANIIANTNITSSRDEANNINDNDKNKELKEYNEILDITQAKLSVGFNTNIYPKDQDYYSLLVCNSILDGGMNSKLFKNIRENAGLAYYIFSQLEKFKGLYLISCGIDAQNKEKTVELILEQIKAIKLGDISKIEYESALKSIETGINSLKDNQLQVIDYYLVQLLSKTEDNFDTLLKKVKSVTISDVIKVAKKIEPELVYLLSSKQ